MAATVERPGSHHLNEGIKGCIIGTGQIGMDRMHLVECSIISITLLPKNIPGI